jgi:hypothetical protein
MDFTQYAGGIDAAPDEQVAPAAFFRGHDGERTGPRLMLRI